MVSKNQSQYIRSLHQKKFRQQHGAFLVEGANNLREVLAANWAIDLLAVTELFYKENTSLLDNQRVPVEIVTPADLDRIGTLETNNAGLAVVKTHPNQPLRAEADELVLVLDDIRDPGNLGTIIRIADWYGIPKIICSDTTADIYNPKVISATKGSFTRVSWFYTDLDVFFRKMPRQTSVFGAFLDGKNVHTLNFQEASVPGEGSYLVMGNEANGISRNVEEFVTQKLTIPRFGSAESLNVSIATAIILDNWRRSFTPHPAPSTIA
jgi:RNA methyltransferase, TrmH family